VKRDLAFLFQENDPGAGKNAKEFSGKGKADDSCPDD
jgi:hypothetical protein